MLRRRRLFMELPEILNTYYPIRFDMIENYGLDCVDNAFLDKQLDWLYIWRNQCEKEQCIL